MSLAQQKLWDTNGYWIFTLAVLAGAFALRRLRSPLLRVDESAAPHRGPMYWIFFGVIIPLYLLIHISPPANLYAKVDPLDHQEEGVRAGAANQFLHGKEPYRDIYLLYGIGNEILEPMGVFHLFGRRLSSMRRWACVQEVVGPLTLYTLGLIILQTPGALLLLALIMANRNPFWITFRAAWALGAMCFIMAALRRRDRRSWVIAGLSCAIAFLYSKESGMIPTIGVGLILLYQGLRDRRFDLRQCVAPFAIGWGILFGPFLGWLAWTGGLPFLWRDFWHPAQGYLSIWAKAAPPLAAPLKRFMTDPLLFYRPEGYALRWWFPALFCVLTIAWVFQRPATWRMLRLGAMAFFCWLYFWVALGRSDFEHWLKGTPGYWLLLVAVAEEAWLLRAKAPWSAKKIARRLAGLFFVLALFPIAFEGATLTSTSEHLRMWRAALHTPDVAIPVSLSRLGPRILAPGELDRWTRVVDRIHRSAAPGDYVYVYGNYPTLYFLCDVINPTRYADLNYILNPAMETEVIASLKQNPPRVIVGETDHGQLYIPPYGQNIARYIQTHFQPVDLLGGFIFYRPKEGGGS